jgi:hypothetical protein
LLSLGQVDKNNEEAAEDLLKHSLGNELISTWIRREDLEYGLGPWDVSEYVEGDKSAAKASQELSYHVKYAEPLVELTGISSKHESQRNYGIVVASRNPCAQYKQGEVTYEHRQSVLIVHHEKACEEGGAEQLEKQNHH